ncbi:hydroxyacid dehydrogenase [candidate division WWE3 bacterium CG08_land_8_20_14_0_20_40_13]|uniref:Hydroxyacid dehydrogenase n=1 Tax=candidate division WWE3 bacterium CG08_land_8_20_14_0_20_40_13 TaxID=1975084 RepID=A0A2H0XEF7_UNCKA|nr:MAG: hydroxyacid dehydrogenase [candidate division WWE3 bacterium CG08_land_8_20_14_0_20_40_13]
MIRTAFFDTDEKEKLFFQKALPNKCELVLFDRPVSQVDITLVEKCEILSGFVYSKFSKEILEKLPKVKLIVTQSTGFDHIDIKYCKKKGITVCNVPEYGSNTVAEHTFALILTLMKRIIESTMRVKMGSFDPTGLTGFDLKGKTLGVIGTGKIGVNVIKIAKGFGMNAIAFDPFPKKDLEKYLGFAYKSLNEVLAESDIVTLHCPSCEETKHIINDKNINLMKDGTYLINTARGGLIETQALFNALKSGKIAGAGLDVLEEESFLAEERELLTKGTTERHNLLTLAQNHVLVNLPNVIVTPHNAFNSKEALQRILDTTVLNIESFIEGNPINTV